MERRILGRNISCNSKTVGNVNEETILQYIKEQEENDKLER